ncbi:MAG: NADH-quinone oxidoreductase subunit NuoG [Rhodanobacteraceae bacterium]
MSAQPQDVVAPDTVTLEIDGRKLVVPKGSMIIQAADKAGIPIPRFCYHEKLTIAANCRMCLVEVEKAPKPLPACATPVADGMKVFTQSGRALSAQRNVMEFLLINHPLDCPICDQGGECELQDLSMGYGRSVSRFAERKRVLTDENLGPLIATEMTRCIQCTRCVRFMGEIAGTYELGGLDRGENLEIGTYIGKALESELSGNVIDVCPVGALTNKVFRFRARAWELIARPSIGYHDALGSNLWLHTRRGDVLRTVPRDNEAINECWLSDRDRYSHEGLYAEDRARAPLVKRGGEWIEVDWNEAIRVAAEMLRTNAAGDLGVLVHPATSSEEGFLLAELARGLGSAHIDHRLRRLDFADGAVSGVFQMPVAEIECADVIVLIGCNPRYEVPLINARIRKAAARGARVYAINSLDLETTFALAGRKIVRPGALSDALLGLARAATAAGVEALQSGDSADAIDSATDDAFADDLATALAGARAAVIIAGELVVNHPAASKLRAVIQAIADATNAAFNEIPDGANAIGLVRAGVTPGEGRLDAGAMQTEPCKRYLLFGCEPPHDCADGAALLAALGAAESVVAFSAFASEALKQVASVILPIGLAPEIDATLVNLDGSTQVCTAGARLPGDARPGWKVLRALGTALALDGFDFTEITEVRERIANVDSVSPTAGVAAAEEISPPLTPGSLLSSVGRAATGASAPAEDAQVQTSTASFERITTTAIYRADPVLRRATALNAHPLTRGPRLTMHPDDGLELGIGDDAHRLIGVTVLPVGFDYSVPRGAVWIEAGYADTDCLPPYGASIEIKGG